MARRRYELTDKEWVIIEPLLPNKPRGVPRVDDRRVLNGILWRFRSGSPWAEIPERYGPSTTCYNRFARWRKSGVWDRLLAVVSAGFNGELVMIDSTCVRVHQHGATAKKGGHPIMAWERRRAAHPGDGRALSPGAALPANSMLLSTLRDVLSACD
jgi:transposase